METRRVEARGNRGRCGPLDVMRLAVPAIVSYILNNAYRINDQYWIQGLGADAQAAVSASMFVLIMNFSVVFLAMGGALSLVSRATGARDFRARDTAIMSSITLVVAIAAVFSALGPGLSPAIAGALGLEGETAELATTYIGTLYLYALPLALIPTLDTLMIAMGNTWLPMLLQLLALSINFLLNPILIYGARAAELDQPFAAAAGALAQTFGIEGSGIEGAAMATVLSRVVAAAISCVLLFLVFRFRPRRAGRPRLRGVIAVARIGAPISLSIATYAGVYWVILSQVLTRLGNDAVAGLGLGFQIFEGISYPCYLGVGMAGATLIGQSLGARDRAGALRAVRSARWIGSALALVMFGFFQLGGPIVAPHFSEDPGIVAETMRYVVVLSFSQFFVAAEVVNEKVLLGSGTTRPVLWITGGCNLLRVPISYVLAFPAGLGALGVWWAINATSVLKAGLLYWIVEQRRWLPTGSSPLP